MDMVFLLSLRVTLGFGPPLPLPLPLPRTPAAGEALGGMLGWRVEFRKFCFQIGPY
jgi:hypothetical protein